MTKWYELTPVDTLFFRGAQPMEAGQSAGITLFPPPVSVIQGSLRTTVLKQQGISFSNYNNAINVPEAVTQKIGKSGENAPFSIGAVLIKKIGRVYAPAPASWFVDTDKKIEKSKDFEGLKILKAKSNEELLAKMSATSSSKKIPLVAAQHEAVSLVGNWISFELLGGDTSIFNEGDILTGKDIYETEERTGIAINSSRKVIDGMIYSAAHVRLREEITLVISVDSDIGLLPKGTILLGGEQRVCGYEEIDGPKLPNIGTAFMSLAPIIIDEEMLDSILCAAKPVVIAGWDMAKGFHKATISWLPAGSVFNKKVNKNLVPLAQ